MRAADAAATTPETPPLLVALFDHAHETQDLRSVLWGTTEALGAVARALRPFLPVSALALEAAERGRRVLTEDVITTGLGPVEEAAEAQAQTHLAAACVHYCMAFRYSSAGHTDPCLAALLGCLRALSLAIAESDQPAHLQEQALLAYTLGTEIAEGPRGEVAHA